MAAGNLRGDATASLPRDPAEVVAIVKKRVVTTHPSEPSRNGELFRWCLSRGLKNVQPMTLMSHGLYSEPGGPFLPSILY